MTRLCPPTGGTRFVASAINRRVIPGHEGRGRKGHPGLAAMPPMMGMPNILGAIAKQLSMEPKDLLQQLRDGKSMAEIIAAQGSSVDAVIQALSAPLQTKLDQAVAGGKITAEQAKRALTTYQDTVRKALENPGLRRGMMPRPAGPAARGPSWFGPRHQANPPGRGAGMMDGRGHSGGPRVAPGGDAGPLRQGPARQMPPQPASWTA